MGRKPIDKIRHRRPDKSDAWVEKLSKLFLASGLRSFSMNEVSAELGISKATLYKYYATREEILEEVVQHKLKRIAEFQDHLMDDSVPFTERFVRALRQAVSQLSQVSNQFLLDVYEMFPAIWRRITDFIDRTLMVFETFYRIGVSQGYFRKLNPSFLVLTDRIFLNALANPLMLMKHNLTFEQALDDYFRMKFLGVFAPDHMMPDWATTTPVLGAVPAPHAN